MTKKIFIGGAWPYANNSLHLDHIAALLPGDIIARYYRKTGASVLYVSGTDCHGTPITLRAKDNGVSPEQIALEYHQEFKECFEQLNFSYDSYTLTHNKFHDSFVKDVIKKLFDSGEFYEKNEPQAYCEHCQQFLSDREIEGKCPICGGHAKGDQCDDCLATFDADLLLNKSCKYCGSTVSKKDNIHLYWKLSKYQKAIHDYVTSHKEDWRFSSINESLKYLFNGGLIDRAVTRQLTWGINVLIRGFEDKKIYVWIEAVLGYLSAGIKYCQEHNLNWQDFYKNSSNLDTYYVHGKDNIPFHTIIFPALLLALDDDLALPNHIVSSQFLNIDDEKISKSKGNGITVKDLLKSYTADSIRYCLTCQAPETKDTNFSYEVLEQLHNKSLVGEYGNFVNRNLAFLVKNFDGHIPNGNIDLNVISKIKGTYTNVGNLIEKSELRAAVQEIQQLVRFANKYYDDRQPWIQVKQDISAFNDTTATCLALIVNIANLYEPFIPNSSQKVYEFFGISKPKWEYISIDSRRTLKDISVIFNRI